MASDSARREDHFQKRICPKRTFPSNFVKLVSKILYLFLAEKWSFVVLFCCFVVLLFCCFVVLLFCCFVVLLFCCFVVLLFCCLLQLCPILAYFFFKTLFKGNNFAVEWERPGVNSILTTILRFWPTSWTDRIVCLVASDSARREDHFQKKNCPKRTFPSNFVKLVSKILYLFLAEKWSFVVLLFCFVVCCNFVRFWLTFFFNWSFRRAEKDAFKEKIIPCTVWELLNP